MELIVEVLRHVILPLSVGNNHLIYQSISPVTIGITFMYHGKLQALTVIPEQVRFLAHLIAGNMIAWVLDDVDFNQIARLFQ